ncbi:MAG: DEAD/DEAH box helicase [Balneola sp.]|nr:DEAD/DEAH box helicase [Balneola sp.]MBO6651810.1 DEAD/DEAH box helicase [Balneola sp.]MBO6710780.1 DEAD/DEAH box helicase [Balneola sp.]MBO6799467.1 DEAD/DEAH box helicase [Balneola sp.]MBO6870199.1 DEAD/DEAH box helicase [Balneola sp.]
MPTFKELGLKQELLDAVEKLGFTEPTEVQELAIPTILASQRDLIALAQTGTGKTGAFGLPALNQIDTNSDNVQVLVLSPTRELAIQIARDLKDFAKYQKGVKTVAVYGGANISTQIKALNNGCQVVIGTPGRMLDLINRKKLDVRNVKTLVLDEADEMLNMGFQDDLDAILADTPREKQTLLFSATMPKAIAKMSAKYMNNPEEIEVGERNAGAKNVEHHYYMVHAKNRFEALKRIVDMNPDVYGIIFCRTRRETSEIATKLNKDGYDVDLLNGDLSQAQRDDVMNRFRTKDLQLLVATDVAARGLDVNELTHVINYNLPDDLEVYIHRSGRTGRAGNSGISISIIHTRETRRIRDLEKMSGKDFIKKEVPSGEEICGIRMLDLIDTIKDTKVNENQLQKFLPQAMEKLADLDREALIKQFLSVEFNQFLDYYSNSNDLNAQGGNDRKGSRNDDRGGRNDRGGRSGGRDRGITEAGYERFFINVGRRDGLNPVRLMGLVNEQLNGSKPDFGKIDLQNNFSFFEVETGYESALTNSVTGAKFEGRDVAVERAQDDKKSNSGGGGRSGGGRRKSNDGGFPKGKRKSGARKRSRK